MELRDYQKNVIEKVLSHLELNDRCCVSLATGGGKTVVFSNLIKRLSGRVLILVHREELVNQTSNTLSDEHDLIIAKSKKYNNDLAVAMVQTLWGQIKRGKVNVNDYDYIIVDECHRGEFMKVLDLFENKVIGFTATPNYEKTRYFFKCLSCGNEHEKHVKCCGKETKKYKTNVSLSEYYHTLIEGVEIGGLIEQGYLVPDESFVLPVDTSRLVYDERKGDYTEESISLVFGSAKAIQNTIDVFLKLARGQKTMIFNPNTLVNKRLYEAMLKVGINCKVYDSNNCEENRIELVEWFKNTPDAVLLNVQVFTTGFDCTDLEVVFLNKKTQSINSYIQMVGRGGRITDKIFKPTFKVIDLGNNHNDFGKWSDKRDWAELFYLKLEPKKVGVSQPGAIRVCHACQGITPVNSLHCAECGVERLYIGGVIGLPQLNGKPILPSPESIINYCLKSNLGLLDARKMVYKIGADAFKNVTFETFRKAKASGLLYERVKDRFKPYYFAIQKSQIEGNRYRTMEAFFNEIIKEIERRYTTSKGI
jgi:superfamily II DNA or RNA helicase